MERIEALLLPVDEKKAILDHIDHIYEQIDSGTVYKSIKKQYVDAHACVMIKLTFLDSLQL